MSSTELSKLTDKIQSPTLEAFGHALAGASAGAFALSVLYPLDQIKVRNAVQSQSRLLTYNVIIDDFVHLRINHIMDIYRGLSFGVLQEFTFNGIYFFFYQLLRSDWKRRYSTPEMKEMPWITSLIRGSIAGLLTQLFTTPLKVIQLRKQTASSDEHSALRSIIPNIVDQHGITGFWSGMKASVFLVINPAIVQLLYGKIRTYLILILGRKSALIDFIAGALSKAIATVICYPLVRIRMNLQAGSEGATPLGGTPRNSKSQPSVLVESYHMDLDEEDEFEDEKGRDLDDEWLQRRDRNRAAFYRGKSGSITPRRTSMSDIFQSTIQEKGVLGLYSGLGPKLVHASLTNAIMFVAKEKFVVYTFAMMLYLVRIREQGRVRKKTTTRTL